MGSLPLRIINVVTNVLVGVIVVFALLIVVGKPFGVHAFAVLSGSMEPAYHTGALIYVKEVKPSTLDKGDVITFMTGKDTTVTHRIVEEVQGEDGVTRFQTQGDANSSPDGELVHPDNVIGTPVIQIPMLGYVVNFIQFPPGTYIAISVCALAVFFMFLPDLFTKGDEDEEEGGEGERDKSPERGDRKPRRLLPGGAGSNPDPAYHAQGARPQAAYVRAGQGAEYGRPAYAQKPRGQQAARPVYAAGPQSGPIRAAGPQQALPESQVQRASAARPAQAQQSRPVGQQARPAQMRQQAPGQMAARPHQARPAQQQAGPIQQQRPTQQRSAQPQPAQRPATSAAGANNPRLRSNPDIRSTQNALKTNSQQARPARRPVS